jgi:hypothetical protein
MAAAVENSIFKVALDGAHQVWVIEGDRMPSKTSLLMTEYVGKLEKSGSCPDRIRILGSLDNSEFIVRLYRLKVKGMLKSLEIGSPMIASNNDAASSLIKMRMAAIPPSMGGWHEAVYADCVSYGVSMLMQSGVPGSHAQACELMRQHPVWNYMSFIPHLDQTFFTKVMSKVLDPRWFIDHDHPSRLSRLYSWLGLCNGPQTDEKLVRKFDVYSCWSRGLEDNKDAINSPGWFLIREARKRWGDHKLWISTLRTSQLFVKFMKLCWMDSLYPYPNPWMEKVFDPRLFFGDEIDSIGFMAHMKNVK